MKGRTGGEDQQEEDTTSGLRLARAPLLLPLPAAASVLAELGCIFILKEKESTQWETRFSLSAERLE